MTDKANTLNSVSVVPGHARKVFVPYKTLLPAETDPRPAGHVLIHASATKITDQYIELDRDLLDHERDMEGDEEEVEKLTEELEDAKLDAVKSKKALAGRRIKWDYMVYVSHRCFRSSSEAGLTLLLALRLSAAPFLRLYTRYIARRRLALLS